MNSRPATSIRLPLGARAREMFSESLLRNSALLFLATVELAVGGFLFWQVVAHLYSPAQVGRASVLLSTSMLIANIALLGMNNSLIRYLPEWPDRAVTVNTGRTMVAAAAAAGSAILVLAGPTLVPELADLRRPFGAAAFTLFTIAFATSLFDDNLFIALRHSGYVLSRYTMVVCLRTALVPLLIGLQAFGVFGAWSAANALTLIFYLAVLGRTFGLKTRVQVDHGRMRAMWRYSAGSYLATAILTAPTLVMPALVAQRLDSENAGYYYIASLVAGLLGFVPQATARTFFAEAANDPSQLRSCLVRVSQITLAAQVPLLLAMVVLGRFTLSLFGPAYVQAYPLLVLLAFVMTLSSVGFIGSTLLLVTERLKTLCQLSAAAYVIGLGGAYLMIPHGLVYVGWSLLCGEGILTVAYLAIIARQLRATTSTTPERHGAGDGSVPGRHVPPAVDGREKIPAGGQEISPPTDSGSPRHEEVILILGAYDLTGSFRAADKIVGGDHYTVARHVALRAANGNSGDRTPRTKMIDEFMPKIEELVERSEGRVGADVVHDKLAAMGFTGTDRTTRQAVAAVKKSYQAGNRRVYRPWIPEPGMWLQWDWGTGPEIGGRPTIFWCAWLAWSKFRVVLPVWDRTFPTVVACLDTTLRTIGGTPTYALTDNEKTATDEHVAGIDVRDPEIVLVGQHYGLSILTCVVADTQTKGGVENAVKIAKRDLVPTDVNVRGSYTDFGELEAACAEFCARVNNRVHTASQRRPAEALGEERARLHPLPERAFTAAFGETRKVSWDATISVDGARYSVPHTLVGTRVWVRFHGDELIVTAVDGGVAEAARHARAAPGQTQLANPKTTAGSA